MATMTSAFIIFYYYIIHNSKLNLNVQISTCPPSSELFRPFSGSGSATRSVSRNSEGSCSEPAIRAAAEWRRTQGTEFISVVALCGNEFVQSEANNGTGLQRAGAGAAMAQNNIRLRRIEPYGQYPASYYIS